MIFNDLNSLRNNISNKMKENVDAIEVSIDGVSLFEEEALIADDDMLSDDPDGALLTFLVPDRLFEYVREGNAMALLGIFKLRVVLKPGVTRVFGEKL